MEGVAGGGAGPPGQLLGLARRRCEGNGGIVICAKGSSMHAWKLFLTMGDINVRLKVNAFIHCFVSVRRMTSVHDLDVEICRSEGVEQFEELGLGALLHQLLVQHYFSVPSDASEVCKITVEDLISRLSVFLYRAKNKEITVEEFLDFLVQKYSVATRENLGVRIQSLGVKKKSSGSEEKLENQSEQRYEIIQIDPSKVQKLEVTNEDIRKFVATWKEACQKHTSAEVLALMLHIYGPSDKQKRKMLRLFLSYPGVGLLNVAVQSIKYGLLDRVAEDNVVNDMPALPLADMLDNDPLTESEATLVDESSTDKIENRVTIDDVIKQISAYFGLGHLVPRQEVPLLEKLSVFCDCEIWLKTQFSIKEFKDLGFGNFLEFLNKHASLLPSEMHCFLTEKCCGNPPLEVSMLQQQLLVLPSQAARNLGSNGVLNKQLISVLLKKQFPSISFQILGSKLENISPDLLKNQNNSGISCAVYFSGMLLGNCCNGKSLLNIENISTNSYEMITNMSLSTGSFSVKDAIKCLLEAPLLSDLRSWSHWDLIFAPSLGPLLDWLLNEGYFGQLSCMVTCDGRILRIDNSATFDEFLEAFIQGSSFKVAVKLLTLFAAYGGAKNVPASLLKCYAERAINVLIKNTMDHMETKTYEEISMHRNSLQEQGMVDSADSSTLLVDSFCSTTDNKMDNKLCKTVCGMNEAYAAASKIILDCLGHLPSEFRSFAAEILVPGLQIVTHNAAAIILSQCKRTDECVMLHDIGLSLGMVEWIEDYHEFSSAVATDLFTSPGTANNASETFCIEPSREQKLSQKVSDSVSISDKPPVDFKAHTEMLDGHEQALEEDRTMIVCTGEPSKTVCKSLHSVGSTNKEVKDANFLIETIRREEFGLDPDLQLAENSLLKKQHARLDFCSSNSKAMGLLPHWQEEHFVTAVQNADDNSYPDTVEPTLVFILKSTEIIVPNNEKGFSEQNIRALCDVGNSTKKGSSAGYIGQKGIGFKSVFRVTDALEIHSNGFHVKFDISEGEIGFVCPTIIPPYDINHIERQLLCDDQTDTTSWNTCVVLPFPSKLKQGMGMNSVIFMFSELLPSLLLFLHRICIKFKNMLDDKLVVMRRETLGDGMVMVSHGKEKMSWLVVSCNLQPHIIRHNVKTTKIVIAFTLQKSDNGEYKPHLNQQPVFAFLPLRKYGLKFILQGDFVLPSSREEVDGDSAWNQWLLSEFPDLFIKAEKSFSRALAIQEYGPELLIQILSSICHEKDGIRSMGLDWLASWLNALYTTLSVDSSGHQSFASVGRESNLLNRLREIPFIPLSDGSFGSMSEGPIWLPSDDLTSRFGGENILQHFPGLSANLRVVTPFIFSTAAANACNTEGTGMDNLVSIISFLRTKPIILTNHGYKCPSEEPIHFSKEFGNSIDIKKLIDDTDIKWNEIDAIYLKLPGFQSLSYGMRKWREFFQELGVNDFVQVVPVQKKAEDVFSANLRSMLPCGNHATIELFVNDWESVELVQLLSALSSKKHLEKCKYLLEVLDKMWDDCFSAKAKGYTLSQSKEDTKTFKSSFMESILSFKWVASSMDEEVHYPNDLFYDCEAVQSILGTLAPNAIPKLTSGKFLEDIGFKIQVTLDDALRVMQKWREFETAHVSISSMSKFYTFIRDEMAESSEKKAEAPPPNSYLQILLQLSYITSPKEASHEVGEKLCIFFFYLLQVFQVFLKWADDLSPESMKSEELLDLKESLIKPENTVLPTIQDKWVSLHPQFGLICWSDDKELMEQFMHFNDVSFLQFGELNEIEKKALMGKAAGFLRDIGIPALSEVVTREPVYYGMVDANENASLVNWVLPYAQRYISKLHHDIYIHLKQSGFEKLSQLQIVVVEELFYRNTLKGHDSGSKRRLECSCLLQIHTHYFWSFLDFFFHGAVEPYIANFLHTITLMAELGSTEAQLESYIVNSQKVPELPDGEPIWSLLSPLTQYEDEVSSQTAVLPITVRQSCSKFSRKITKNLNWPPTNWKNAFYAPDGRLWEMHQLPTNLGTACFASDSQVKEQPWHATITSLQNVSEELPGSTMHTEDQSTLMENDDNSSAEDDSKMAALLDQASENMEDGGQLIAPCSIDKGITRSLEPVQKLLASITVPDLDLDLVNASTFTVRDRLCMETPDEDQAYQTGRLGETVAFKYFREKFGPTAVKWANEETETGLPYDLIIEEEGSKEFIEVKTTTSASKDWFPISTREWHCAAKKGDSFSIARVFLSGPTNPDILILKNPWELCQQRMLQLALLMPCSTEN
ncbi:hypothetical protein COCNU_03G011390 [Cocos nucifera]|uniref:Protein NO VEIN C-terminal domain-containing protein n=1 Tax=Cocos nucifera TaxID=13894 RepID=A0A8K0MYZ9_COCNU|nr:hypothetical protein COCNU_03G011390 [Cocos nucifera]